MMMLHAPMPMMARATMSTFHASSPVDVKKRMYSVDAPSALPSTETAMLTRNTSL